VMLILDPNFFHPSSPIQGQKDSRIRIKKNLGNLTQKIVSKFSEI
jgi:hypothetical protein